MWGRLAFLTVMSVMALGCLTLIPSLEPSTFWMTAGLILFGGIAQIVGQRD